jgi:hypothetical protein
MSKKSGAKDIVSTLEDLFAKVPSLPEQARVILFKITPWLALVFGGLGVLGSLIAIGVMTAIIPLAAMNGSYQAVGGSVIMPILSLISSGLVLAAAPGLFKKKYSGWILLFWSEVVGVVESVIFISIGGVLGALIGFYLLFQIKSYYK